MVNEDYNPPILTQADFDAWETVHHSLNRNVRMLKDILVNDRENLKDEHRLRKRIEAYTCARNAVREKMDNYLQDIVEGVIVGDKVSR